MSLSIYITLVEHPARMLGDEYLKGRREPGDGSITLRMLREKIEG